MVAAFFFFALKEQACISSLKQVNSIMKVSGTDISVYLLG